MNLYKLIYIPYVGKKIFRRLILVLENGEMNSNSLRKYMKDRHNIEIGKYSYGACFDDTFNYAGGGAVKIGRYCSFGSNCHYFGANHPLERFSTSPIFYRKKFGYKVHDVERFECDIGNDVWFGYGCLITSKCHTIGNGAVIAAGSIVTKDVPPYAVVAGNPAKVIKYRFDNYTIDCLEKSKWFELDPEQIIEFKEYFSNPNIFSAKIIEKYRRQ